MHCKFQSHYHLLGKIQDLLHSYSIERSAKDVIVPFRGNVDANKLTQIKLGFVFNHSFKVWTRVHLHGQHMFNTVHFGWIQILLNTYRANDQNLLLQHFWHGLVCTCTACINIQSCVLESSQLFNTIAPMLRLLQHLLRLINLLQRIQGLQSYG